MTPKEKADYLIRINSLTILSEVGNYLKMIEVKNVAKQCALIAVDELIKLYEYERPHRGFKISYWDEVKQEIEKL
jgi:hypothetical protein